jgi:polar amino acid transport system substrate-binding protein
MNRVTTLGKSALILAGLLFFICHGAGAARAREFRLMSGFLPPFNFTDKTGQVRGISTDILITILNRAGIKADYNDIESLPWLRAHKIAEKEPNAILYSVARTPRREKLFQWIGPIHTVVIGFIAPKKLRIKIKSPDDLKKYHIGVLHDSAPEQVIRSKTGLTDKNLVCVSTMDQLMGMLRMGRVDMIAHADMAMAYLMAAHHMKPSQYEMVFPVARLGLYFACSFSTPGALVLRLQKELDMMKAPGSKGVSEFDGLLKSYLSGGEIELQPGH